MTRTEIFEELARRGATRVDVRFSGGGDEGGVDVVVLYGANGKELARLEDSYAHNPDPETQANNSLITALSVPMDAKYGSFAGEYSVQGRIVYDVVHKTVQMVGAESWTNWQSFSEDLADPDKGE